MWYAQMVYMLPRVSNIYLLCHIEYIVYIDYEKKMHDQYVAGLNHNS